MNRSKIGRGAGVALVLATLGFLSLACGGGETSTTPAPAPGAAPAPAPSGDVTATVVGNWQFRPTDEEFRTLQIIKRASQPGTTEDKIQKSMTPPLNDKEMTLFRQIKKNPDDPSLKPILDLIDQIRTANQIITSDTLTTKDDKGNTIYSKKYRVTSKTDKSVTVALGTDEEHTWTLVDSNTIRGQVTKPVNYQFTLKRK
jgi:hypothetical protein